MGRVFIVMPLRVDVNVEAKREIVIEGIGDSAVLPDIRTSNPQPDFNICETVELLRSVDLLIADLSFERPSCYFELGMAQAIGVRTFLIAESGTPVHQHSGSVIFYTGLDEFRHLIESAVSQHISDEECTKQHNKRLQQTGCARC